MAQHGSDTVCGQHALMLYKKEESTKFLGNPNTNSRSCQLKMLLTFAQSRIFYNDDFGVPNRVESATKPAPESVV